MLKDLGINRPSRAACIPYFGVVSVCCLLLLPLTLNAVNLVHVDVGKTGQVEPHDTIYMGGEYELRILIENEVALHGMWLYYEIWSDDGLVWEWLHQPDGWGRFGLGDYPAVVTIVPGSRLDPIEDVYDMSGLRVGYISCDGISPDSIASGGSRQFGPGILPGEMQHMLSYHFRAIGPWSPGEVKQMCIRDINFPASDFIFVNTGASFVPEVNTPICIPIKTVCGDANGDGSVNLADVGFILCVIFYDCYWLDPWQLADANGDSGLGMGDAGYIINYIFYDGPAPVCSE